MTDRQKDRLSKRETKRKVEGTGGCLVAGTHNELSTPAGVGDVMVEGGLYSSSVATSAVVLLWSLSVGRGSSGPSTLWREIP